VENFQNRRRADQEVPAGNLLPKRHKKRERATSRPTSDTHDERPRGMRPLDGECGSGSGLGGDGLRVHIVNVNRNKVLT
jgi:hypothetical protein